MTEAERARIFELRRRGWGYRRIAAETGASIGAVRYALGARWPRRMVPCPSCGGEMTVGARRCRSCATAERRAT
jgi:hypothetical protein